MLDASEASLDIVKKRLEDKADIPVYLCSDIVEYKPTRQFKLWHDRAMFHFLTGRAERMRYFEVLKASLLPEGIAIINTFAVGGESQCAGLGIRQYDERTMAEELPEGLSLFKAEAFTHLTPKKTEQLYSSFIIKRV